MTYTAVSTTGDDMPFAHDLTESNMRFYYTSRGLVWNSLIYKQSWAATANYRLELNGLRIGILRLSSADDTLYLRDIQILPINQSCGAGSFAIAFAERLAIEQKYSKIGLRVFSENPAKHLYNRLGFQDITHESNIWLLIKRLT